MIKNPQVIKDSILDMGGTVEDYVPERGFFYVHIFGKRILIGRKISIARDPFVSSGITSYKDVTYKTLKDHNLPTPHTLCFYNWDFNRTEAQQKLKELSYPIIIKYARGSNSKGIFPSIQNVADAMKILDEYLPSYGSLIAQPMVQGKEYRILVLDEKVIGALEMIPPRVTGDGHFPISELIKNKQLHTNAQTSFDEKLDQILTKQNSTLETVLEKGQRVFIKKSSSLAEGGETKNVTPDVHEELEKICVSASKAVGKHLAGIDVMCEDIIKDPHMHAFNIIEINGKPDLYIHYNPTHGETVDVVKDIITFMAKS